MKRILLLSVLAALLSPMAMQAQQPQLRTEADSLSYAFGAMVYEQGIVAFLEESGVVTDTAAIRQSYMQKMESASAAQKTMLEAELNMKLDSAKRADAKNIAEFTKGMKDAVDAPADKAAYLAGLGLGGQMAKQALPMVSKQIYGEDSDMQMNAMAFISGLENAILGNESPIVNPMEYLTDKMQEAQARLQAKKEEAEKAEYADVIAAGEAFLASNKTKEGVATLPSGLQYKILTQGTGAIPTEDDHVTVHYEGRTVDGTVFDSSIERNEPATFGVTQVIKGWTEALKMMPVGSKWELYIPSDLAYGARAAGEAIKPYSTLIFTIELLGIE